MIPTALHSTALAGAEAVINRALQYDPATQKRLAALQGKVIQLTVTTPPLSVVMVCRGDQVSLHPDTEQQPDVALQGAASDLMKIAMASDEQVAIAGSGVEVRGSLDTLQQVKNILSDLDIDWQAALAELVGDIPSHLLMQAARSAHRWQQDARQRAVHTTRNFVLNEAQLSPAQVEMEQFTGQVRQLSTDVDRLAARINRIQLKLQRDQQQNQQDDQT